MKNNKHIIIFPVILLIALILSCSQEKNTLLSTTYHNITGRYNGYFLAKERLIIVEENLWKQHVDDYNRVLEIFPKYDTTFAQSAKADLDYIFEYASIAPQKHKNSKWVDDSYLLLGKVKFYSARYDTSNTLFKYVNTKSPDDNTRHSALIWLLRSHLELDEYRFAYQIHDYLKREKVTTAKTKVELNLAFAQFERINGNYDKMLEHLLLAIPHIKNRYERSRINYIIGQLYQQQHQDEKAYVHFRKALKGTPPYEIEFFSKLSIAQVSGLNNSSKKKIYKYFAKLLKDAKNEEYKDKIYYEMAKFEFKQDHLKKGFVNINQSLAQSGGNQYQKAYTYLLAAETNYNRTDINNINRYKLAKAYYDSTTATMDPDWPEYEDILERDATLDEFVKEITIVETEDSLQRMSKMDPAELDAYIEKAAIAEEARLKKEYELQKRKEEAARQKELLAQMEKQNSESSFESQNTAFPFYNSGLLISSKQTFVSNWGNRPLEDNWRRSNKDVSFSQENATPTIDSLAIIEEQKEELAAQENSTEEPDFSVDRQAYYDAIPKSDEELTASNERLKKSLYNLGKVYYLKLDEPQNAVNTFIRLNKDFPDHDNHAETIYFLYIICEKLPTCNSEDYKQILLDLYPHSIYAKLAQNPNYLRDNKVGNALADSEYEKAYNLYTAGYYTKCLIEIKKVIETYPTSSSLDKMQLLRIMCLLKTQQGANYKKGLEWFVEEFKTSKLRPFAYELLGEYEHYASISSVDLIEKYVRTDSSTHYLIGVFDNKDISYDKSTDVFYEFHKTYYKSTSFSTSRVDYSLDEHMIVIKEFSNFADVKTYHDKLVHFNEFGEHYKNVTYKYYIIGSDNYNRLINKKDLNGYGEFYKQNY